jgi:hypothetical protein
MLRYITSTLAVCALASTASVFGQQAPAPPAQAPAPPAQKEDAPKATLTGCVMEAKTTEGGTAYVLDKAEGGSDKLYVLVATSPSELAPNVNKKVEVTGPVRQPNAPAAAAEDGAASTQKVLRPPAVLVESVKVVAESCSN